MLDPWVIFSIGAGSGAAVCALFFLLVLNRYLPVPPERSRQVDDCSRLSGFAEAKRDEERVQQ